MIGLMKHEYDAKIMTTFVELRPKVFIYLLCGGSGKRHKKHVIKHKLKFEDHKKCLKINVKTLKSQ